MNESGGNSSNKSIKKISTILIVLVISIFAVVLFFNKKEDHTTPNVVLDTNTIEILDSLGDDDRINDFLLIYGILQNVDLADEKKINTQKLQIDEIAKKWNIKTAKLTPHTSINTNTIHFFHELVAPAYYEKAPFQKNSLDIDIYEIENLFVTQGFRYHDAWSEDSTHTRIKYYKSNELNGPYCSISYHDKDDAVEYVHITLLDSQREWSGTQMESHLNQTFDEQMNDMINLAIQDLISYKAAGENPMLDAVLTNEDIDILNWFLYQLNDEQLRRYDVINNEDTIDCLNIWIQADINDKSMIIGFGLNGIDISIYRKDAYTSEFEKNFHLLKQAFWDEPDVIINSDVPNLNELYTSRENHESDSSEVIVSDFIGEWQDSYSQRASLVIDHSNDIYSILIDWGNSADESMQWRMTGTFVNGEKPGIISQDCTKVRIYSGGTEIKEEVIYTGGEALLFIKNGNLYWTDNEEQAGDRCIFEKFE